VLWLVVGAHGRPHNVRAQPSLEMGLDEKAVAAVSTSRFQPATLNGQPVAVQVNVEVNFGLYGSDCGRRTSDFAQKNRTTLDVRCPKPEP
jgi:TonB-like protein